MEEAVPICFALDHTNYARWMTVFINDLKSLKHQDEGLFNEISKNLSVRTSSAKFSRMAHDQKHEHNNKWIKSQAGYINLVNKEEKTFLRKLETCTGEVHHYLESFENRSGISKQTKDTHKEDSVVFNTTFVFSCYKVYRQMKINPFATQLFQMISSSKIFPQQIEDDCGRLLKLGQSQHDEFVKSRLTIGAKVDFMDTIPRIS